MPAIIRRIYVVVKVQICVSVHGIIGNVGGVPHAMLCSGVSATHLVHTRMCHDQCVSIDLDNIVRYSESNFRS